MDIRKCMAKSCLIYLRYYKRHSLDETSLQWFITSIHHWHIVNKHGKSVGRSAFVTNSNCYYYSSIINLTRNSSTLRPLEMNVQPRFNQFSFANKCAHLRDQSMLVLYPGFCSCQQCCQFICAFTLLSAPPRNTPIPSEFQS